MYERENELARNADTALEAARFAEKSRRLVILSAENPEFNNLSQKNNELAEQLGKVPLDWRISLRDYGVSFLRDYPYQTPLYGIAGWDACRLVIDLNTQIKEVALRFHGYDAEGDMAVEEGMLIREGKVVAMNEGRFDIPDNIFAVRIWSEVMKATGNPNDPETLRCLFDGFSEDIGPLPGVREICGETFGKFATRAHYAQKSGELVEGQMPVLAVGWPMQEGHYLITG